MHDIGYSFEMVCGLPVVAAAEAVMQRPAAAEA
jgi:hypothetical protein